MDLHVGYSSWGIDRLFHIILNACNCAMPNVHVRLHDRRVEDNVDALLAGKLELAFIFVAPKPGALRGLRFLELSREHIRLAVSPAHPFARRRAVSVEDAARQPFIVLVPEEFPDYHFFVDAVFASTKNKPTIVEEHDSVASLISAVEGGRGVGLAGDGFGYVFGNRVKILPLMPDPKIVPIGLAARKGTLSPAAETFWQCAKQAHSANKRDATDGDSRRP
jgi:DNA-binding transcriptional LysR family regulator